MLRSPAPGAVAGALLCFAAALSPGSAAPAPAGSKIDPAAVDRASAERSSARRRALGHPAQQKAAGPYTTTDLVLSPAETGTPFSETFTVMTPFGFDPAGPKLPLLMAWNGYGLSAKSFFNLPLLDMTDLDDEANARGWLAVAVTCIDDKSYGWVVGQLGVQAALEYVIEHYPVDADRIYAVGWSAGGGSAVSYAARHLNPARPMIAAVGTNAGTYNLVDTYNHLDPQTQDILENASLFGGPPVGSFLFNYQRTQGTTSGASPASIVAGLSSAANLRNVPIRHVFATDDSEVPYAPAQNQAFAGFMAGIGAPILSTSFGGLEDSHSWDLLDAAALFDWFASKKVVRAPLAFSAVADRDDSYYWVDLDQNYATSLARVDVAITAGNVLTLAGVTNVTSLEVDPPAPFDRNKDFTLACSTSSASQVSVIVPGVSVEPDYVLLGTQVFDAWTYDPFQDILRFTLPGSSNLQLRVRFDEYGAVLNGPSSVAIGNNLHLSLSESTAFQPYVLIIGFAGDILPLSLFDPADERNILVAFAPPPALLLGTLDGAGAASHTFPILIPALSGQTLNCQFLTFPGGATIVDQISDLLAVQVQ